MSSTGYRQAFRETGSQSAEVAGYPLHGGKPHTPVFILASPRPDTGKTFLARLLIDFLWLDERGVAAFDLNRGDTTLADMRPAVTARADLATTQGQIALFDRLILDDGQPKVVDLGHAAFDPFFNVFQTIGFATEAARRGVEPVILYAADAHQQSIEGYARLQGRFASTVLVPVFNEAIAQGRTLRQKYPFVRAAAVPLQIPFLPPALRAHADRAPHTFADFHATLPVEVPIGPAFELRSWTKRTFLEFRELELRLLLEKLRTSLTQPD